MFGGRQVNARGGAGESAAFQGGIGSAARRRAGLPTHFGLRDARSQRDGTAQNYVRYAVFTENEILPRLKEDSRVFYTAVSRWPAAQAIEGWTILPALCWKNDRCRRAEAAAVGRKLHGFPPVPVAKQHHGEVVLLGQGELDVGSHPLLRCEARGGPEFSTGANPPQRSRDAGSTSAPLSAIPLTVRGRAWSSLLSLSPLCRR